MHDFVTCIKFLDTQMFRKIANPLLILQKIDFHFNLMLPSGTSKLLKLNKGTIIASCFVSVYQ